MARRRATYSPEARAELAAILARTTDDWGPEQARRYRRELQGACDRLVTYPELGRAVPTLEGIRSVVAGHHRILYRPVSDGVYILRFFHERMNVEGTGIA